MIKNISIFGGTHGNEWTGVYLIQKNKFKENELEIKTHLSNPEAYQANKRYIDEDLNRCFDLNNQSFDNKERKRAKEILELMKDQDFVIDLHTTTSNMGPTLILVTDNEMSLKICKQAKVFYPEIKIIKEPGDMYLVSRAKEGVIVEVGPCPQGVLKDKVYHQSLNCISALLKAIKLSNKDPDIGRGPCEIYEVLGKVDYPRDEEGKISAMVHDSVQDNCFDLIKKGDPLFSKFNGEVVKSQDCEGYPIFINEAAYYEKGVAFVLTQKGLC